MAPVAAEARVLGEYRLVEDFFPSPLNPRKHFDKTKMEELVESVRAKGIIEPLVAREAKGKLEIVAGERRYKAAKTVGLEELPVVIRQLTDVETLEIMVIENGQRDDLHPLEEAEGFRRLMKEDPAYTPAAVAAKVGKSVRYVQQRMALGRLLPAAQKAFLDDDITAGHADLISRLSEDDQAAALKACFSGLYGDDRARGCLSIQQLDHWIEANVRLELTVDDPQMAFLPELTDALAKTDPATLIAVASGYIPENQRKQVLGNALPNDAYRAVRTKSDRCTHAQHAVIVIGAGRGTFIDICTAKTECKKHWKWEIEQAEKTAKVKTATKSGKKATHSPKAAAADTKAKEKRAAELARTNLREQVLDSLVKRFTKIAPAKPSDALLALIAAVIPNPPKSITWKSVAVAAVTTLRDDCFGEHEYKALGKALKPLGLDVAGIEKEVAPKAAAQTSTSMKKAKK